LAREVLPALLAERLRLDRSLLRRAERRQLVRIIAAGMERAEAACAAPAMSPTAIRQVEAVDHAFLGMAVAVARIMAAAIIPMVLVAREAPRQPTLRLTRVAEALAVVLAVPAL